MPPIVGVWEGGDRKKATPPHQKKRGGVQLQTRVTYLQLSPVDGRRRPARPHTFKEKDAHLSTSLPPLPPGLPLPLPLSQPAHYHRLLQGRPPPDLSQLHPSTLRSTHQLLGPSNLPGLQPQSSPSWLPPSPPTLALPLRAQGTYAVTQVLPGTHPVDPSIPCGLPPLGRGVMDGGVFASRLLCGRLTCS